MLNTADNQYESNLIPSNSNQSQEEEDVGDNVDNEIRDLRINEEVGGEERERGSMEASITAASSGMIQHVSTQPAEPSPTSTQPAEPASTSTGNCLPTKLMIRSIKQKA